jgi:acetyl esterase/lipase
MQFERSSWRVMRCPFMLTALGFFLKATLGLQAAESMTIWPGLAPGETSDTRGTVMESRPTDTQPITRVEKIRLPTMDVYPASQPNGTGVVILPGGGFGRVVVDLEGSEAAVILNRIGITAFVLRYRTNEAKASDEPSYLRPVQDAQRAVRYLRANAAHWKLDPSRMGVLGFSAGGQAACVLHTRGAEAAYHDIDEVDKQPFRPDFSILIYPWNLANAKTGEMMPELIYDAKMPPAFIVHTSDDASTSVGSAKFYLGLKEKGVPAELHIYENGGHGYGTRARPDSNIGTWPDRAVDWLIRRSLGSR